jgi:hypothetical protein
MPGLGSQYVIGLRAVNCSTGDIDGRVLQGAAMCSLSYSTHPHGLVNNPEQFAADLLGERGVPTCAANVVQASGGGCVPHHIVVAMNGCIRGRVLRDDGTPYNWFVDLMPANPARLPSDHRGAGRPERSVRVLGPAAKPTSLTCRRYLC